MDIPDIGTIWRGFWTKINKNQQKQQHMRDGVLQKIGKVNNSKCIRPNAQGHDKLIICMHIYTYIQNKNHISLHGAGPWALGRAKDIWFSFCAYVCICICIHIGSNRKWPLI